MNKAEKKKRISRNEFLGLAWIASVFALVGQASVAFIQFFQPQIKEGDFGGKVNAGKVAEFNAGSVSHIQKGRFFISHLEGEGLLAIWHRCTHLGCTVPYREDEARFNCPCHSSIFNNKGEVLSGPAPRPLDIFPIEIVDDDVIVDTGNAITRSQHNPSQATKV